ncbi:MAG: ArnT family glycosyltransferase [Desulfosudaceae bacterium]
MKNSTRFPLLSRKLPVIGIMAVLMTATLLTWIVTGHGLAIEGDGYYYINAARIMAASLGMGGVAPVAPDLLQEIIDYYAYVRELWPPLYPALLAAVSFSADPYPAGRWLHLIFPAVIGILTWMIVYRNKKSNSRAFWAIALILLSPEILRLNHFVFSESLFLILQLAALLTVSYYLRTRRRAWLVMTVILIALAGLTRYIGVMMAPALAWTVWRINQDRTFFQRTAQSLWCVLFSVLPIALYMFSTILYSRTLYVAGRSLAWDWPLAKALIFFKKSLNAPILYLTPADWPRTAQIVLALSAVAAIIVLFVHQKKKQRRHPPAGSVLELQNFIKACLVIYLVMASLLALYLDHMLCYTGITTRHFAPLFVWLVIFAVMTGPDSGAASGKNSARFMPALAAVLAVGLISVSLVESTVNAFENRHIPIEKRQLWEKSSALARVRDMKPTPWLVSNLPGEMFQYLKTPVFALPSRYDFFKAQTNPIYGEQMDQLRQLLHQHDGIVLYFDPGLRFPPEVALQATSLKECQDLLYLEVFFRDEICVVLRPR